jgi:hypothetical protein
MNDTKIEAQTDDYCCGEAEMQPIPDCGVDRHRHSLAVLWGWKAADLYLLT